MAPGKSTSQSSETHMAELEKCNYHLSTLFDISRELFSALDVEVITKNCLLATMGSFGLLKGFIVLFDRLSQKTLHMVSEGIGDTDLSGLEKGAVAILRHDHNLQQLTEGNGSGTLSWLTHPQGCVLPFQVDAHRFGLLGLGSKIVGESYTEDEKTLLDTLLNNMVVALRHANSFEEIKRLNQDLLEKKNQLEGTVHQLKAAMKKAAEYSQHLEQIIAALNVAQEVQQSLLPAHPPKATDIDISGRSIYCDETGGDYFDYIALPRLGPDAQAIAIGDVSGHGISSALLMAGVRAYLRSRAARRGTAAEIISDVNRLVSADTAQTSQFMTLFFLIVEPHSNRLTWVRAGHDPAMVYSPESDEFSQLDGQGLPLGVSGDRHYQQYMASGQRGQILILATDGVMEAHNPDGEMFGRERFKKAVRQNAHLDADGILAAITEAVTRFRADASQEDDITLVVVKL